MTIFAVGIGGAIGASLRYFIGSFFSVASGFPVITLFINWCGSFLFGYLINQTYFKKKQSVKLFLTTGFLGGFTTFSTFSLEAFSLFEQQQFLQAFTYIALSGVGSVSLCFLGLIFALKGGRTA